MYNKASSKILYIHYRRIFIFLGKYSKFFSMNLRVPYAMVSWWGQQNIQPDLKEDTVLCKLWVITKSQVQLFSLKEDIQNNLSFHHYQCFLNHSSYILVFIHLSSQFSLVHVYKSQICRKLRNHLRNAESFRNQKM